MCEYKGIEAILIASELVMTSCIKHLSYQEHKMNIIYCYYKLICSNYDLYLTFGLREVSALAKHCLEFRTKAGQQLRQ